MTWQEWCNSEYNIDGFCCDLTYVFNSYGGHSVIQGQTPSDVICNGCEYSIIKIDGGSND